MSRNEEGGSLAFLLVGPKKGKFNHVANNGIVGSVQDVRVSNGNRRLEGVVHRRP